MTTSAEQIAALIDAGNEWKSAADQLLAERNDQLDAHRQGYEDLVDDLRNHSVVLIYVDPDTGDDEGLGTASAMPLATVDEAIRRVQPGIRTIINLTLGKTYEVTGVHGDKSITAATSVEFVCLGAALGDPLQRPVLRFKALDDGVNNGIAAVWRATAPLFLFFTGIHVEFEAWPDAQLPVNDLNAGLIRTGQRRSGPVVGAFLLKSTYVSHPGENSLLTGFGQIGADISLSEVLMSGGGVLMQRADDGSHRVMGNAVTQSDGSRILDGGTIGGNVITNIPTATL